MACSFTVRAIFHATFYVKEKELENIWRLVWPTWEMATVSMPFAMENLAIANYHAQAARTFARARFLAVSPPKKDHNLFNHGTGILPALISNATACHCGCGGSLAADPLAWP